jgi:hypothetical protein
MYAPGETLACLNVRTPTNQFATVTYRWIREGLLVGVDSTYVATGADVGKSLHCVRQSGEQLFQSNAVTVKPFAGTAPTASPQIVVAKSAGKTQLTCKANDRDAKNVQMYWEIKRGPTKTTNSNELVLIDPPTATIGCAVYATNNNATVVKFVTVRYESDTTSATTVNAGDETVANG